jgi:hypothetical protein
LCLCPARYRSRFRNFNPENKNAICARALAQAQTASLDQTLNRRHDAASFAPAKTFATGPQAIIRVRK